jgi:hypothetical protein
MSVKFGKDLEGSGRGLAEVPALYSGLHDINFKIIEYPEITVLTLA